MRRMYRPIVLGPPRLRTTDPLFANVKALFHFDGTNGGTTFTDNSSQAIAVTRIAATETTSTTQSVFGGSSLRIPSTSAGLRVASGTNVLNFPTSDWTIQAMIRFDSIAAVNFIFCKSIGTGNWQIRFYVDGSAGIGSLHLNCMDNSNVQVVDLTHASGMVINTWYSVAARRIGSTFELWLNNIRVASFVWATNGSIRNVDDPVGIGNVEGSSALGLVGYIDEFRVSAAANFSLAIPATTAFPDS